MTPGTWPTNSRQDGTEKPLSVACKATLLVRSKCSDTALRKTAVGGNASLCEITWGGDLLPGVLGT